MRSWCTHLAASAATYGEINSWVVSAVKDMTGLFRGCSFNNNIDSWQTGSVTSMAYTFCGTAKFNQNLNSWKMLSVTTTKHMFDTATSFNQALNSWQTGAVRSMHAMFFSATAFSQNINAWQTHHVVNMGSMFSGCTPEPESNRQVCSPVGMVFNENVGAWQTGQVTSINSMFHRSNYFSQDIDAWRTGSVVDMARAFASAVAFNQPLNSWQVGSVTTLDHLFSGCNWDGQKCDWLYMAFDQSLSAWRTEAVESMTFTFLSSVAFNQDIDSWQTSGVTDMASMFFNATAFNQDLSSWELGHASANVMANMFFGTASLSGCHKATMYAAWKRTPAFAQHYADWALQTCTGTTVTTAAVPAQSTTVGSAVATATTTESTTVAPMAITALATPPRETSMTPVTTADVCGSRADAWKDLCEDTDDESLPSHSCSKHPNVYRSLIEPELECTTLARCWKLACDYRPACSHLPECAANADESTSLGAVIGATLAAGVLLLCCIAGVGAWALRNTRKRIRRLRGSKSAMLPSPTSYEQPPRTASASPLPEEAFEATVVALATGAPGGDRCGPPLGVLPAVATPSEALQPREIDSGALVVLDRIGGGNFGAVHKGLLNEQASKGAPAFVVAVKTANLDSDGSDNRKDLLHEAALMARFDHPNIVALIGVVLQPASQPKVVMQHYERGSLKALLQSGALSQPGGGGGVPRRTALRVAGDVAAGMAYFEARRFVHRDLAARNVLVSANGKSVVADFGLSRRLRDGADYYKLRQGTTMPIRWSAPEVVVGLHYTTASDVWSFFVLMWEVWSGGQRPFGAKSNGVVAMLLEEVKDGATPVGKILPRPEHAHEHEHEHAHLLASCWAVPPGDRASFSQLCTWVRSVQQQLQFTVDIAHGGGTAAKFDYGRAFIPSEGTPMRRSTGVANMFEYGAAVSAGRPRGGATRDPLGSPPRGGSALEITQRTTPADQAGTTAAAASAAAAAKLATNGLADDDWGGEAVSGFAKVEFEKRSSYRTAMEAGCTPGAYAAPRPVEADRAPCEEESEHVRRMWTAGTLGTAPEAAPDLEENSAWGDAESNAGTDVVDFTGLGAARPTKRRSDPDMSLASAAFMAHMRSDSLGVRTPRSSLGNESAFVFTSSVNGGLQVVSGLAQPQRHGSTCSLEETSI